MELSARQKNILDIVIRDYIESARPVSSQYLENRYDFGICPATIRNEMQKLTDLGYLSQPHTSAGRVPTDKGYRLFVDSLMDNPVRPVVSLDLEAAQTIDQEFEDLFRLADSLTRSLAQASSSLVLGYLRREDVLLKEGWEDLLQNPEFSEKAVIGDFIDYLSYLEDNVKHYKGEPGLGIFIGQESRLPKGREFAAMTFICQPAEHEEVILSIVGPKRMAYERNIALTDQILKLFETF
jgi:heat-inducible transcriptional repressor